MKKQAKKENDYLAKYAPDEWREANRIAFLAKWGGTAGNEAVYVGQRSAARPKVNNAKERLPGGF